MDTDDIDTLRARLYELENAITWGTSCLQCSALLDRCYDADMRAEQSLARAEAAELTLAELRAAQPLGDMT